MTITRDLIATAFPGQPRMQAAFEALVNDAETATDNLNTALAAISGLSGGADDILAALAGKQPKNDTLDAISILGPDPGVLEQIQAGIFAVRPIDATDVKSLMTRELADTRYLGGAHGAASAAKWTTARSITITGDGAWTVTVDGSANASAALTIANDAVTYAKMQNVSATSRFLGRITAGAGDPEELTGTQATTLLDTFTSALKGLVPASGGGTANFLRADGTWAAAGSSVTPAALTKTDDTNVTLTLGGTPATALLQAVSVTVGWAGQLAVARGGTGASTAATARTNLGLVIGTNVQAWDADLDAVALSGIATAASTTTPTPAANTGAFTTASSVIHAAPVGKWVFFSVNITITAIGTAPVEGAAGFCDVALPYASVATIYQSFGGRENGVTGKGMGATILPSSTTLRFQRYDGTAMHGNGYVLTVTGVYERA